MSAPPAPGEAEIAVTVRLFAQAREAAGTAECVVHVPLGSTVQDVLAVLAEEMPALGLHLGRCSFGVNEAYAGRSQALRAGDELAVIPPIGGG
ncbi:MAG: MoaD/ThiS family protein [Gemmatimonadetes bacterium]|nr:MoaD/ThiS family protein [Gemmatimonadota bacterium]